MNFSNKLSRRAVLQSMAVTAAGALLPTAASRQALGQSSKLLYVNTWGGTWTETEQRAFFAPYTERTGVEVRTVSPVSFAALKAQVESGRYEWDVTAINEPAWVRAYSDKLVEPLDWSIIDRASVPEDAITHDGVAVCVLSTNLCYRTDKFPENAPQTWADFWDVERFPGNRGMYQDGRTSIRQALLADGVPVDQLYPMDIDRALAKLSELKPHVKVWWRQAAQSQQLIRDGEVDLMPIWNSGATNLKRQGAPIEISWHQAMPVRTILGVVRGASNRENAFRYIQLCLEADRQAEFTQGVGYGPANVEAFDHIPAEAARGMPTHPDNAPLAAVIDPVWEAEHSDEIEERFLEWLVK
ncbi:ABC transporter substrate-binding protein [Mesorhizobium sp. 1B3]|uniref:ABC transporter substrate-binding protein n=1 Tax=Mesorhizobium sp. 1B3 TaxID=3243599 RepID=UPI003D95F7B0